MSVCACVHVCCSTCKLTSISPVLKAPSRHIHHAQHRGECEAFPLCDTERAYRPPLTQVAFVYNFRPSETFYARPFGLVIDVYYIDQVSPACVDSVCRRFSSPS